MYFYVLTILFNEHILLYRVIKTGRSLGRGGLGTAWKAGLPRAPIPEAMVTLEEVQPGGAWMVRGAEEALVQGLPSRLPHCC